MEAETHTDVADGKASWGGLALSHTLPLLSPKHTAQRRKHTRLQTHTHTHTPTMRIRGWSAAYCRRELQRPAYIFSRENKISETPLQQENTPDTQTLLLLLCALNANESGDLGTSDKSPSVLVYAARRLLKLGWCMFHMTRIQTALAGEILTKSNNLHNRQLSFQVNGWKWWMEMQYQLEISSEWYHQFTETWFIYYKLDPETAEDCQNALKGWWWQFGFHLTFK